MNQAGKYGDFGIGTFNGLDGEMVFLDNIFYQIKSDGNVYKIDKSNKTPFAAITYFESDKETQLEEDYTFKEIEEYIDGILPSRNLPYAVKIKGKFKKIKVRSVPKQKKPYAKLIEIVKNQPVFELTDVEGTIVGFILPQYTSNINVPGCHFHFITEDKKKGGHVLEFSLENAVMQIDYTYDYYIILPQSDDFFKVKLEKDNKKELNEVEK